jgi:hypothetical protein
VEATLPGIGTRRWPWHNDASSVPDASSSWSGPNTSATRGMKSQRSASGRPGPTNGSAGRGQMSLSHAKGLPSNQHRVLADGTPGRLAAPAHQCTECSLCTVCTVVTSRTDLPRTHNQATRPTTVLSSVVLLLRRVGAICHRRVDYALRSGLRRCKRRDIASGSQRPGVRDLVVEESRQQHSAVPAGRPAVPCRRTLLGGRLLAAVTRTEVDGLANGVDGERRRGGCRGHPGHARRLLPAGQQCGPGLREL